MKKHLFVLLAIIGSCFSLVAQTKLFPEQRIYLWDVTGSLLPKTAGQNDIGNGKTLPTYIHGNGLWNNLKTNLINSIEAVEADGISEIVIVPFYGKVLETKHFQATNAGKQNAIAFVKNRQYTTKNVGLTETNLSAPIEAAYSLAKSNWVNYIFVFTDGIDTVNPSAYRNTVNSWTSKTQKPDRWTFGFYVLVDPVAKNPTVVHAASTQKNFYIVPDATQIIHLIQMPNKTLDYSIEPPLLQGWFNTIRLAGNFKGVKTGVLSLSTNNDYYDVDSTSFPISAGELIYSLKIKDGVTPPVDTVIELEAKMSGNDGYTFQTIKKSKVRVFNRRLNVMRIEPIKK